MPEVSVIIPTYNRANLVAEAMQSVLDQSFSDFELIIVDDGSVDNTEEVVGSFADSRLMYLKQPNKGVSAARNAGLEASSGKYIAFLDSDDLFLPGRLAVQLKKFEKKPGAGMVYGRYLSGKGLEDFSTPVGECHSRLGLSRLLLGPAFHWSTVLIRRKLLEEVGGFDEQLLRCETWELDLRLALADAQMVCVEEAVAYVRKQSISLMRDQYHYEATVKSVVDKVFNDPHMPEELKELKNRAFACQLVRTACSAYVASQSMMGKDMLIQALNVDPTLKNENIDILARTIVHLIKGLSIDDPQLTLKSVMSYLPGEKKFQLKLKRQLWGKYFLIMSFQAYQQGRLDKCRAYAIQAIAYNFLNLRNRGLLSILLQSLLRLRRAGIPIP